MTSKKDVVIVGAARTAIGTFGGALKDKPACDLGAQEMRRASTTARLPAC